MKKRSSFLFFILIFAWFENAPAHKAGEQAWCLVFSVFHQECIFNIEFECHKNLSREATRSKVNETHSIPKGFNKFCIGNEMVAQPESFFEKPY